MNSREVGEVAREFAAEVGALVESLGINREAFSVRANRCEGRNGEASDEIYHVWIGLRGFDPQDDIRRIIAAQHDRWKAAGWAITRFRHLDSGGVNLAATDPATGWHYALDSGFESGPDSYVVGFFNTSCFENPSGTVRFGALDLAD